MRRVLVLGLATALAAGCGWDGRVRTPGRLVQGGRPFAPPDGAVAQVLFVPLAADGTPPTDYYVAEVDQAAGTFRAAGRDGKGMPPGKYRVAVEVKKNRKDLLGGKFDPANSPVVVEVDAKTPEVVVDLGPAG